MAAEASNITFEDLPSEVLTIILSQSCLTLVDVTRLAQTCSKLNSRIAGDLNDVWQAKHAQRWPGAHKECRKLSKKSNWQNNCKHGMLVANVIIDLLEDLWPTAYRHSNHCHTTYEMFEDIIEGNEVRYHYVKDELLNLINDQRPSHLTIKYYAHHAIRFVRQEYLAAKWQKFCALPVDEQLLEIGASIVAQWCQPFIEVSDDFVGDQLDAIAVKVLESMRKTYPGHPIHSTPYQVRQTWRYKKLNNNMWDGPRSHQVIEALELVLCKHMRFHGSREHYHDTDDCFINKVLERHQGTPLAMNIVIESIARRLGIHTEPRFHQHIFLVWKENFLNTNDSAASLEYSIDIYNEKSLMQPGINVRDNRRYKCPFHVYTKTVEPASPIQVIQRLAAGVELAHRLRMPLEGMFEGSRTSLELLCMIEPLNLIYTLNLGRMYRLSNISTARLCSKTSNLLQNGLPAAAVDLANHILGSLRFTPTVSNLKVRTAQHRKGVYFAVGMVMKHRLYHYTCVITGWDPMCTASSKWKQEMNVDHLTLKDNQPFYNVLVEDSSNRYAAQENLEPLIGNNQMINILDIGRYFDSFENGCYVPNAMKEREYPDDGVVRRQFYGIGGEGSGTS